MTTHISKSMIEASAIDADKIDPAAGGSTAHNNMPPYQIENLFIYAGV